VAAQGHEEVEDVVLHPRVERARRALVVAGAGVFDLAAVAAGAPLLVGGDLPYGSDSVARAKSTSETVSPGAGAGPAWFKHPLPHRAS